MIDEECLHCKRYYSGSCNGVEDRKRETITTENSCSGFLKKEHIKNDFNGDGYEIGGNYYAKYELL